MENVQKDTVNTLKVVEPEKVGTPGGTPTQATPRGMTPREELENTLNYLTANYNLLQGGLFIGKDTNVLIQVKAWLENQQKALQLQLAKQIAADAAKAEQSNG